MKVMQLLKARGAALRLTIVVLCNVFIGLLTQLIILRELGIGEAADALVASQAVPAVVLAVLGTALAKQLIPFFKEYGGDGGMLMPLLLYTGAAILLLVLVLLVMAHWWLPLLFAGLAGRGMQQLIFLNNMALLALVPGVLVLVLTGYWQSRHRFLRVEIAALISALIALVSLVPAISAAGAVGAMGVLLARPVMQSLLLLWRCDDYRFVPPGVEARQMLLQGLRPALSAATIFKLGPLVDRALAAYVGAGAIALLNFLQQVYGTLLAVVDRVFSPRVIASVADARDTSSRIEVLNEHNLMLYRLVVAATVAGAFLVLLLPVLMQFFIKQPFLLNFHMVAVIFAVFLVAGVVGQQSASFLYGANLSAAVFRIALAGFAVSMAARFVGLWVLGFYGLVLGIALYQVLNAIFLSRFLRRYFPIGGPVA